MREHAIAQSAISSNRIEGVEIDQARVGTVVFGHPALKDRDEEEVAGYRDALNLDFLRIHPFRDGNGRVSRLLLLLTACHLGIEVGRYISLERLIEHNKERYYETLRISSQGWHEGKHDPWPCIGYLLFIVKQACDEFAQRAGEVAAPKGEKADLVLAAIRQQRGGFRLVDIEKACPGVGRAWIQTLLADMKAKGELACSGKGPAARWRVASASKGSTAK